MRTAIHPSPRPGEGGQTLVEFSLAITVFLIILMGVVDLGTGIYKYNGVSEAARELARVASVHPGTNPTVKAGWSSQLTNVLSTQKAMVPGLNDPTIVCLQVDGTAAAGCAAGAYVKVTITAPYRAVTPLLGMLGTWTMQGSSSVLLQ